MSKLHMKEQHMGRNVAELITEYRTLDQQLRKLISLDGEVAESAVQKTDKLISKILHQILAAKLNSESDLRSRIEFLVEQIGFQSENDSSIMRKLELVCADFEELVRQRTSENFARRMG